MGNYRWILKLASVLVCIAFLGVGIWAARDLFREDAAGSYGSQPITEGMQSPLDGSSEALHGESEETAETTGVTGDGAAWETAVETGAEAENPRPEPLPLPSITANTAVVMELNSGMVLYEQGAHEKIFPASTTKVLTALLAVEEGDLDKMVTVSGNAAGVEGSSIYLLPDEEISLRDLVYGLMLRSGNDAAIAISEEIGGATEDFVAMMNRRAAEIGAENTHFMNPNGLHHDDHYTTAYDMALMARQGMLNPSFRQIVGAKSWQATRADERFNYFYNKNKVVFEYEGGTGVKIGYTKTAGRTLVASSARGDMELICVVMGAPDWFNDSYRLMDYVYSRFEISTVAEGQKPLQAVTIKGGTKDTVYVGTKEDVTCPVEIGTSADIAVEYQMLGPAQAPVRRWQEAGMLTVCADGEALYSVPLYYMEDINKK